MAEVPNVPAQFTEKFALPHQVDITPALQEQALGNWGIDLMNTPMSVTEASFLVKYMQHGASATVMDLIHTLQQRECERQEGYPPTDRDELSFTSK